MSTMLSVLTHALTAHLTGAEVPSLLVYFLAGALAVVSVGLIRVWLRR
ncbi:MAG: hypothetical protein HYY13_05045 [Nitrospirae bacterium]|nr:hypothetical protein [Nitrospirota bacterium]